MACHRQQLNLCCCCCWREGNKSEVHQMPNRHNHYLQQSRSYAPTNRQHQSLLPYAKQHQTSAHTHTRTQLSTALRISAYVTLDWCDSQCDSTKLSDLNVIQSFAGRSDSQLLRRRRRQRTLRQQQQQKLKKKGKKKWKWQQEPSDRNLFNFIFTIVVVVIAASAGVY